MQLRTKPQQNTPKWTEVRIEADDALLVQSLHAMLSLPPGGLAQGRFVQFRGQFWTSAHHSKDKRGASTAVWVPCKIDRNPGRYSCFKFWRFGAKKVGPDRGQF